jgi:hypothetical protein
MTTSDTMPTHTIREHPNHMDEKVQPYDNRPAPQINKHGRHADATNATL